MTKLLFAVLLLVGCGSSPSWTKAQEDFFAAQCLTSFPGDPSQAIPVCACMLGEYEDRVPNGKDGMDISKHTEDLNEAARACVNTL